MAKPVDRYAVNDALARLAAEQDVELDDDTLNELTHQVSDVLDREKNYYEQVGRHLEETPHP